MPVTAFTTARIAEFKALLLLYGTSFSYKGATYPCIADPLPQSSQMKPDNYDELIPSRHEIWATAPASDPTTPAFDTSTLDINQRFTRAGITFEISEIIRDDVDATVILMARRKQ